MAGVIGLSGLRIVEGQNHNQATIDPSGDVVAERVLSSRRRHESSDPERPGRYHFEPGEEMQHDTSPHVVAVGGRRRTLQCASLVLCYSRRQYVQCYPGWSRFEARVFLTEAIGWLGGAAQRGGRRA